MRRALGLAVVGGVLHGACFPPIGAWPLAFVALAPLVAAAWGRRPGQAALLGWVEATVMAALSVVPWISAATGGYFRQGQGGALLFATLVGQAFGAAPTALFAAAVPRIARLRSARLRVLGLAAAWTGTELLRSRALTGAPWNLLAHALYAHPLWLQGAELGGAFLVSFVLAGVAAAVGEALARGPHAGRSALATGALVLALAAGWGALRLEAVTDDGATVRVALVQGNVPNAWRVDPTRADDAFRAFADATASVTVEKPDLIVWPENAVSFLLAPNARFVEAVAALLGPADAPLVLGGPRFAQAGEGRVEFFNSAYQLAPSGAQLAVYDKRHLVPFAEYTPGPRLPGLGWRFNAPGGYTPGTEPTVFARPAPFGVLICFEAIYPELARDLVRHGARFLLNLSNDAWFGNSAGLEQHFAIAVLRAVETRRALARATNTGVTALVGPSGRILARFPAGVRGAWVVPVPLREGLSPYARVGDVFAWLAVAGALAALAAAPSRGPGA